MRQQNQEEQDSRKRLPNCFKEDEQQIMDMRNN